MDFCCPEPVIAHTYELKQAMPFKEGAAQKNQLLSYYLEKGYKYIRRVDTNKFLNILREPTVGCEVELYKQYQPWCVNISSYHGKQILNKVCYF